MKKIKINKRSLTFFLMFVLGIFHWYLFMNLGQPTFKFFDWKLSHQFHDVFKQSVQELKIPYHATMFNMPNADNKIALEKIRWLAHGSQLVSPHLILLSFFKVPTMMTLNIIFYFSIGFWGILLWIKKFNLSILSSIFLILIWCLNGYLTPKMGIGHFVGCNAYLFIPMYFWLIYQFIQRQNMHWKENIRNVILFSLFIFFTKLNANGQNVYQFLLVGSVVILFYPKQWGWYIGAIVLSMLLMTFYIVPTAMFSEYINADRMMQAGYGRGPFEIVNMQWGLLKIVYHIFNIIYHVWNSLTFPFNNAGTDGLNHEFNLYVSLFGFILLCCCSVAFLIKNYKTKIPFNLRILFAFCIISALPLSNVAIEIHNFIIKYIAHYPLIDRVPSRLAIYPLSLIFLISALGFDYFFQIFPSKIRELSKFVVIIILSYFLLSYSYEWFVISTEFHADLLLEMQDERRFFTTNILDIPNDKNYITVVNISYLLSFITALILVFVLYLISNTKK